MSVITLDGPAGAGKSTIARELARRLGWLYLDTGAMYRALAWAAKRTGIAPEDEDGMVRLCERTEIGFENGRVMVNGVDISSQIRTPEMDAFSSLISRIPAVRRYLTELQRGIGGTGDVIAEGRDMGTVVFPEAGHKFFLTASLGIRASRRKKQLEKAGCYAPYEEVLSQMQARDEADSRRDLAPLRPAPDACEIDTSDRIPDEVVDFIMAFLAEAKTGCGSVKGPQTSS